MKIKFHFWFTITLMYSVGQILRVNKQSKHNSWLKKISMPTIKESTAWGCSSIIKAFIPLPHSQIDSQTTSACLAIWELCTVICFFGLTSHNLNNGPQYPPDLKMLLDYRCRLSKCNQDQFFVKLYLSKHPNGCQLSLHQFWNW